MLAKVSLLLSLSSWTVVVVGGKAPATNTQTGRSIKILNESGGKVEVYWVHPTSRKTSLMSTPVVFNGASFPLDSFVGHEFEVREVPNAKTGICNTTGDATCHSGNFEVSGNEDQSTFFGMLFFGNGSILCHRWWMYHYYSSLRYSRVQENPRTPTTRLTCRVNKTLM
jgi:hypothetical protein